MIESKARRASPDPQWFIAAGLVGAFFVTIAVSGLPLEGTWPLAAAGAVLFSGVAWWGNRQGRGPVPTAEGGLFMMVALALLCGGAILGGVPIPKPVGAAMGIGYIAALTIWALLRWRPPPRQRFPPTFGQRLREAVTFGAFAAGAFSLIAGGILLLGGAQRTAGPNRLAFFLRIVAGYFAGGFGGAAVYATLRSLSDSALGTILLGWLIGTCCYGAVAPAVAFSEAQSGTAMSGWAQVGIALLCGLVVGPVTAVSWRSE